MEAAEDALSERLRAAFRLLGSTTYCRGELPEPDDTRADRAAGVVDQQGRGGIPSWRVR